jgi:4,5-DOPA dioxygenase extradiol
MLPSFFIAHGAPTLVCETNEYTDFLKKLAANTPTPRAIVLFSAHWESPVQEISGAETHSMIYDFYGFPQELYEVQYPAPGNPAIAQHIQQLLAEHGIKSTIDNTRGLDHGVWGVLKLLYPDATIPVIAMSVNPALSPKEQYEIGRALTALREQDVLIIGSGGTVHNLRRLQWHSTEVERWAVEFDQWLQEHIEKWDTEALFQYETLAPYALEAVPRNEHFIPLLIAMGAGDQTRQAHLLKRMYQNGNLSLSVWQFA